MRMGSRQSFSGFSSIEGKGASKSPTGPELFIFVHGEETNDLMTSGLQACEQRLLLQSPTRAYQLHLYQSRFLSATR